MPPVNKPKRAALYLRVSTDGQTTANQRLALEAVAVHRGWTIAGIYEDAGISGAKGRDKRPGLDTMLKDATRGKFDVVMSWALDRIGRSLSDLLATLETLRGANAAIFLHQQAIDTTTPSGLAFFQMLGVFSEFERGMIRARVMAGLERAKANPRKGAKAIGRPKVSPKVEAAIRAKLAEGVGMIKAAKELGVGVGTVQRIKRAEAVG